MNCVRINIFSNYYKLCFLCVIYSLMANVIFPLSTSALKTSSGKNNSTQKSQGIRSVTIRRVGDKGLGNDSRFSNSTKMVSLKEMSYESGETGSDTGQWNLKFDPNYFASINAANHHPIDTATPASSSHDKTKSSPSNMYYYSPESYGKTTHKNHQTGSFAYLYQTSSTTPPPTVSNNRYGEHVTTGNLPSNDYSEPAPQTYSMPYVTGSTAKKKRPSSTPASQSSTYYHYDEETDIDPHYYEGNEEMESKYYYPIRNKNKQHPHHDYYGNDLTSSSSSNENMKSQATPVSTSAVEHNIPPYSTAYNTHESGSLDYDHHHGDSYGDLKHTYSTGNNVKFPSKYYSTGHSSGGSSYYPYYSHSQSHSQSPYNYNHGHYHGPMSDYHGDSHISGKSWLGPGIAGILLGILPLGILLASMVPAFVSMPVISTASVGRKKRDAENVDNGINDTGVFYNPVLEVIAKYGFLSMDDPNCVKEMFCAITVEGKDGNSNIVQKLFYNLLTRAPVEWAKTLGLGPLLNAIQIDKCEETFKCSERKSKSF